MRPLLKRAVAEGHYVGPHSDSHPLYCSWDERDKSLVTQAFFTADLRKNIADLRAVGALRGGSQPLFIPPYEWYNRDQVRWCDELGVTLINFTPGSGSNRDYAPEGDRRFVPSRTIYDDILGLREERPARPQRLISCCCTWDPAARIRSIRSSARSAMSVRSADMN